MGCRCHRGHPACRCHRPHLSCRIRDKRIAINQDPVNTMKIKPDGKDAFDRTRLQPVVWLEHGPFTVEVTDRFETAN